MKAKNTTERILAVLEAFSEERLEWMPDQLMKELGYSRPTLYRYLKTLKEAGFLTSSRNGAFTLGPKFVEMDYLVRKSDGLLLYGTPHLRDITGQYACTAMLVRWYGNKMLCVGSECSTKNPLSSYPRGRPMPLGRGAIARSILAFLPRRRTMPLIELNLYELRSVGLGADAEEIYQNLKKVRKAGCAVAYGEVTPGAVGIAAPVLDAGGTPIASLCVTIAGSHVDGATIDVISRKICAAAAAISADLSAPSNDNLISI
jgi:DNA-binding IclR family transcriptional regulator